MNLYNQVTQLIISNKDQTPFVNNLTSQDRTTHMTHDITTLVFHDVILYYYELIYLRPTITFPRQGINIQFMTHSLSRPQAVDQHK